MKHAYKSFLLENGSPVKVCGDESLYALQNTSNNTVTLQGSNTATEWVNVIDIPAGTTKHVQSAFAFLKANGTLHVNRTQGSLFNPSLADKYGNAIESTNKLPVEATNKALPVLSNTGTIGALNAHVEIAVPADYKTASAIFTDGNVSGTFEIQCSFDGTIFRPLTGKRVDTSNDSAVSWAFTGSSLTGKAYQVSLPSGITHVRLACTAYTSGSSTGKIILSEASSVNFVTCTLQSSNSRVGFMVRATTWTRESTTPVNANLTITGAAKSTFLSSSGQAIASLSAYGDKFAAAAGADVVGTLIIDASPNSGTTYYPVASMALTQIGGSGNFGAYLETPIIEATMRARLVNGASNQANAYLTTKMLG